MSGKIYNKNLTFFQDQPFAENLLTGFHYKKRKAKLFSKTDPSRAKQLLNSTIKPTIRTDTSSSFTNPALQDKKHSTRVSFGSTRTRNKSEKMKKAEANLVKHFCLILERSPYNEEHESLYTRAPKQRIECSNELQVGKIIPHLLVSIDYMQNTLLTTRSFRSTERIKPPSHFKKILRESRKIRLLYGNLSRRQLFRSTSKMCFPGENLLIWLESRLDVVLERCGFFGSVKAARQSVLSGHIKVNSKVVKSPGFILEGGDIIKVVQETAKPRFAHTPLPCLPLHPLVDQFSRGAILSNEVFPYLFREKSLATALSNGLQKYKSTDFLQSSLPSRKGSKAELCYNSIADKDFNHSRPRAREFFPYKSVYTWLLRKKQRNFQSSLDLYRHSNALPARELHLKRLSAQNTVNLDRETLSSKNWRFIGSPHLLFSFFFLHGHLQKVISFLADACSKNTAKQGFATVDKRFGKLFSYKTQRWNNNDISAQGPQTTTNTAKLCVRSDPSLFVLYKTQFKLPTISLTSKRCGVYIVYSNSVPSPGSSNKAGRGPSLDTLNIESFLNLGRHSLQKIKNNGGFVNPKTGRILNSQIDSLATLGSPTTHNLFGKRFARVLTELYNNLFPWLNYSNQAEYLSTQKEFKIDRGALSQLVSGLVRKDEKSLLGALLLDLLLYSLLIKKELVCTHLEKKQLDQSKRIVSSASAADVTLTKKQKIFDIDNKIDSKINRMLREAEQAKQNTNQRLDQRLKSKFNDEQSKALLPKASSNLELVLSGSRTLVDNSHPSKMGYKKFNSNQRFDLNVGKRIKPLHLEVSYQSLCAVYLFPPQRVCLPIMIDLDCLAKSL